VDGAPTGIDVIGKNGSAKNPVIITSDYFGLRPRPYK
jgi:hypothetical protein